MGALPGGTLGALLRLENLTRRFGAALALDALSLEVAGGEFVALLGGSGSGKSTLLRLVAGFDRPDSGRILLDGADITALPPQRRDVAMMFQSYALFPHMDVAANIAYGLRRAGLAEAVIGARVAELLALLRLEGLEKRRPAQLSGGQQQRIALARALVFEPEVILMDEPLGALDKNLRERMQYEIKHIHANLGVTVVYVTHDQSEALTMSDRVAVFDDGRIQQLAPPDDLYERPENAFVAAFIGENNTLRGKVTGIDGDICHVKLKDGSLVKSLRVNVEGDGVDTTLSLRPERVTISPADGSADNIFAAEVKELIYLGDHIRVRMDVCGNDEFIVKIPNATGNRRLTVGEKLNIGWAHQDCRALDPS